MNRYLLALSLLQPVAAAAHPGISVPPGRLQTFVGETAWLTVQSLSWRRGHVTVAAERVECETYAGPAGAACVIVNNDPKGNPINYRPGPEVSLQLIKAVAEASGLELDRLSLGKFSCSMETLSCAGGLKASGPAVWNIIRALHDTDSQRWISASTLLQGGYVAHDGRSHEVRCSLGVQTGCTIMWVP